MTKSDCLKTLGLSDGASMDDIKKAYRKLANKHHPDKDGGDNETFTKLSEAYRRLKENKFVDGGRKHYYNTSAGYGFDDFPDDDLDDIFRGFSSAYGFDFGSFFKNKFKNKNRNTSQHIRVFTVNLEDIYTGGSFKTSIGEIELPKGIPTETVFKVEEHKIKLRAAKHPIYTRVNNAGPDLTFAVRLTTIHLMTGTTLVFDHLSGKQIEVDIPSGTQAGTILRIKGKGLPVYNSNNYGDLLIKVDGYTDKPTQDEIKKLKEIFSTDQVKLKPNSK